MEELPPRPSQMIRKSAYGRTQLFVPSTSQIFREVRCMGGTLRYDTCNIYHPLPSLHDKTTRAQCWHCCEDIQNEVIPIPRLYDTAENTYHVYGATCCPECTKAYIIEHTSFDRGQQLYMFSKMMREVYGISGTVTETPPRVSLQRFGGMFSVGKKTKTSCSLLQAPFVSYCMLIEEKNTKQSTGSTNMSVSNKRTHHELEDEDTFHEPQEQPMFDTFIRSVQCNTEKKAQTTSEASSSNSSKIHRKNTSTTSTKHLDVEPMKRFSKKAASSE